MSQSANLAGSEINFARIPAQRESLDRRLLLKTGGITAISGGFLTLVTNGLHPHPTDFRLEALLVEINQTPSWTTVHMALLLGLLLIFIALLALTLSSWAEPAATVSRFAALVTLMGGALIMVSTAMDGFAMNLLARAWMEATPENKSAAFRVAEGFENAQYAVYSLSVIVFLGAGIFLYGLAIVLDREYPKILGWMAMLAGAGEFGVGIIQIFNGPTYRGAEIFDLIFSFLAIFWMLATGVIMWRKATEVK